MVKEGEAYAPKQGDIIWVDFDPTRGHEQQGHRPALVISDETFNEATGFCMACPITSTMRTSGFEVLHQGKHITGTILTHHARSIDFKARSIVFAEQADEHTLHAVIGRVMRIMGK